MFDYVSEAWESVKESVRNTGVKIAIGATVLAGIVGTEATPAKAQSLSVGMEVRNHVVEKGETLWGIADEYFVNGEELPDSVRNKKIGTATDILAVLNGKGTRMEYPWHTGYSFKEKIKNPNYDIEKDPNFIREGDTLIVDFKEVPASDMSLRKNKAGSQTLEQKVVDTEKTPQKNNEINWWLLGGLGLLASGAYALKKMRNRNVIDENSNTYSGETEESEISGSSEKSDYNLLEDIVQERNENPYKSIDKFEYEDSGISLKEDGVKNLLNDYFKSYRSSPDKFNTTLKRYDADVAPDEMNEEIKKAYASSDKSLKNLEDYFENKYGMRVSQTTISKMGREKWGVNNRKEAKELYQKTIDDKVDSGEDQYVNLNHNAQPLLLPKYAGSS